MSRNLHHTTLSLVSALFLSFPDICFVLYYFLFIVFVLLLFL